MAADDRTPEGQTEEPTGIPGLEGPSTPETCQREYQAAADRRANGGCQR